MLQDISYNLQKARWIPWRFKHRGGPLNTVVTVPFRRLRLKRKMAPIVRQGPDDITVIIGMLNRKDFRLQRSLENLRQQDYPRELIRILIVDYGNPPEIVAWLDDLLPRFDAHRIRAMPPNGVWNRAHCLNVGIRQSDTKFILTSDVDVLFEHRYITLAVERLKRDPLQIIYSQCLDLPAEAVPWLEDLQRPLDISALKAMAQRRDLGWQTYSKGINCTYAALYRHVRGYDEFYEGWGGEDEDMARRFNWLGLHLTSMEDTCRYLHQWHPKHEGIQSDEIKALIERNSKHARESRKIIVNDENWGDMNLGLEPTPVNA